MTNPHVTLSSPPADLTTFPTAHASDIPETLYRIFHLRDRVTGALNSPWRFSTSPPGGSRFDIATPEGTCYWSDRRYGCWVEVFRGTAMVDRADVTRRALFTAEPPSLRLADTVDRAAHRFGMTGELSTIVPYDIPQAWAQALRDDRFAGLIAKCRHDPSLTARSFAIFGPAGVSARRNGWTTRRTALLGDAQLAAELVELSVHVAAVPYTVPTTAPAVPTK